MPPREEKVPNIEHKVNEGPELDRLAVASSLCVFAGPEAELEANGDQVGDVVVSRVGGSGFCGDEGVHDSQGGGLFLLDGGILDPVGLELPCDALVEIGVCLGLIWFSGVGKTIQEVGRCNHPPCLRN